MPADPAPGSLAQKDASTLGNMLCRDFLRGVCYRGDSCKFLHSEQHAPPISNQLPVCRDYQNGTCNRRTCKYAHIYSASGFYDPQTMTAIPQSTTPNKSTQDTCPYDSTDKYYSASGRDEEFDHAPEKEFEEVFKTRAGPNDPLCKDFQNGYCQRGECCRYRHVSYLIDENNYHNNVDGIPQSHVSNDPLPYSYGSSNGRSMGYDSTNAFSSVNSTNNENNRHNTSSLAPSKRSHLSDPAHEFAEKTSVHPSRSSDPTHELKSLRNENARLREELLNCKAEIELLNDELEFYRYSNKNNNIANSKIEDTSNHHGSKSSNTELSTKPYINPSSQKYYSQNASSNNRSNRNFPPKNVNYKTSSSNHKPMYNPNSYLSSHAPTRHQ